MPTAGPRGKAQDELALAYRSDLMALAWVEVGQARRGERPLGGVCCDHQLAAHEKDERVLVHLVLLQGLAFG